MEGWRIPKHFSVFKLVDAIFLHVPTRRFPVVMGEVIGVPIEGLGTGTT